MLALIRFAELQTDLWPFTALKWMLGFLLWGYFGTLFWGVKEVEWMPKEKMLARSMWITTLASLIATAGLVASSYWFADIFMKYPL